MISNVIYIAQPYGNELREINQSDRRRLGKVAVINNKNIKFGKAKDINKRANNYKKDVGHINLTVIVSDEDYSFIEELEKRILRQVDEYRIVGPSGRKLEWLKNISFKELEKIIKQEHDDLKRIIWNIYP